MDELTPSESNGVRWTDGRTDSIKCPLDRWRNDGGFQGAWERGSVMAVETDGVGWTDGLDFTDLFILVARLKWTDRQNSLHEKPDESV